MPHADLTGLAARADVSSPMEGMLLQCAGMADVSLRGIRPPGPHQQHSHPHTASQPRYQGATAGGAALL